MGKPLINLDYVWLTQLVLMVKGLFKVIQLKRLLQS